MESFQVYSATFQAQAITTAVDLFEGVVTADRPVRLIAMTLSQTTDVGDAQEEVLRIALKRGVTAGTGGSGMTEIAYGHSAGPTPSLAVTQLRTTPATGGTVMFEEGWNIRVPYLWCPIPELRPTIAADADPFVFNLVAAPTDSVTVSGTLYWAEIF